MERIWNDGTTPERWNGSGTMERLGYGGTDPERWNGLGTMERLRGTVNDLGTVEPGRCGNGNSDVRLQAG